MVNVILSRISEKNIKELLGSKVSGPQVYGPQKSANH